VERIGLKSAVESKANHRSISTLLIGRIVSFDQV
jgi:hypothetical protein